MMVFGIHNLLLMSLQYLLHGIKHGGFILLVTKFGALPFSPQRLKLIPRSTVLCHGTHAIIGESGKEVRGKTILGIAELVIEKVQFTLHASFDYLIAETQVAIADPRVFAVGVPRFYNVIENARFERPSAIEIVAKGNSTAAFHARPEVFIRIHLTDVIACSVQQAHVLAAFELVFLSENRQAEQENEYGEQAFHRVFNGGA